MQVDITSGPAEHDQVLAETGARVFLDPNAAAYLDDKVLDAMVDGHGQTRFMLGIQGRDSHSTQA